MIDNDAIHMALRARALPALPTARSWENEKFTPTVGVSYAEEEYVPATSTLLGMTSGGDVEYRGTYFLRWYALPNTGSTAFSDALDAVLALFLPGSWITAGSHAVRIRGDQAPKRTAIRNSGGWAISTIEIPFRVFTQNPQ